MAALAIVALAGGLLASVASSASAGAQAAFAERAGLIAEGEARRALAEAVALEDPAWDALAAGESVDRELAFPAAVRLPASGALRVQRLGPALYALSVEVRIAPGAGAVLARRRMRLVVLRPVSAGPAEARLPPALLARWSTTDLY